MSRRPDALAARIGPVEERSPGPRCSLGLVAFLVVALSCQGSPPPQSAAPIAASDVLSSALAAKRLCSGLWVSGRERDEAWEWSASAWLSERGLSALDAGELTFDVDEARQIVTAQWPHRATRARFHGSQGCVILPDDSLDVFFNPVEVTTRLPPAETTPWPMGDQDAVATADELADFGIDAAALEAAVETAFANEEDGTAAFVVVHRGRIVAERYGAGADASMQLESWSMGKSLTTALVGLLEAEGHLDLEAPAPVPVWQNAEDDPRAAIRLIDLLQMSSGLRMTHPSQSSPEELEEAFVPGWADHSLAYGRAVDAFEFSESRPLEHPPGTVGRYRNCDPLIAGSIVRRTVEAMGEEYLSWPQRALFDRIGIRRQVLETDAYGNFVLTGFDYGTGRNWARLGMLFLQKGLWQGERLLNESFVEQTATAAPAWDGGRYGFFFWRNGPTLPEDAFFMNGGGGQQVAVVPSLDAVFVRLGHAKGFPLVGGSGARERRDQSFGEVVAVLQKAMQ
ncbi:MAG: serine hydrolase [Acidobacteriota bacterium]